MSTPAPNTNKPTSITPPTATKAATPKAAKAPKEAKPKSDRAPRTDYGYSPASVIKLITDSEKPAKYRGKRKEYYDILAKCDGKTVDEFNAACPAGDSPRGWMRFFVQDGTCSLTKPKEEVKKA